MSSTRKTINNLNRDKIKKFLNDNNITCREVTEKMGLSKGYVAHVVAGESISVPMYKLLCTTLGVTESYFLDEVVQEEKVENLDLLTAMYKELREINYNLSELVNSLK